MKITGIFYVVVATLLLIALTIMVSLNLPFNWVFYLMCLGQLFVVVTVYKVLKDNYTTTKTFDDFYEDNPIGYRS
ncbi:hypothetical protein [Hwangdonia lutea]|uniref:Uncharacterized protein n=1 Tax=Hwangdonia lutea TaxID=3075823 RepID=A0AA97HP17_9FLAO|nr:hypothetical protein [Hwangdonia sp. SCSIO 19198]WOD42137.1 hypothetical protein RNZ46_09015 [Hwangdonia sp. SCSIO 19198]